MLYSTIVPFRALFHTLPDQVGRLLYQAQQPTRAWLQLVSAVPPGMMEAEAKRTGE